MLKLKFILFTFTIVLLNNNLILGQCLSGDCQNGNGTIQYDNGKYEGHFNNGQKDGKGIYTWTSGIKYDGDWVKNTMEGSGTITFEDGSKYIGEVKNGSANENGTYYLANGQIDHSRGLGKTNTNKNNTTTGCKSGDCQNGFGIYYYENEARYEGNFLNGTRSGKGKYFWSTGETYDGEWLNGKMNGQGVSVLTDGTKYKGEYKDGVITGEGYYYLADGKIDMTRGYGKKSENDKKITTSDLFASDLIDIIDDLNNDFILIVGDELTKDKTDPNIHKFDSYYKFEDAINTYVEENRADSKFKYIAEFYRGYNQQEAISMYNKILENIKYSVENEYYIINDQISGGSIIKGIIAEQPTPANVNETTAINFRIEKIKGSYVTVMEIAYKTK